MNLVNETKMEAGWTLGFQRDGRELLIVVVKGTFKIPKNGEDVVLAEEQVPLTEADEFTGEPGFSAPLYESDYAYQKPFCDILLNGSAYAPGGRGQKGVPVFMQVGSIAKYFLVVGNRGWHKTLFSARVGKPEPFTVMSISYDNAFGGVDDSKADTKKLKTFLDNPVGCGFYYYNDKIDKQPMPNTEEVGNPIKNPSGKYKPMSFGPIGRNWQPRVNFVGTYDKAWLENHAPFWPDDFDYRYFQAAPQDQQAPYPSGGEPVILKNLSPYGIIQFELPRIAMPILFVHYRGKDKQMNGVIDTVLIEPDHERFMLTWRTSLPLKRNCFELEEIVIGETAEEYEEYLKPCIS